MKTISDVEKELEEKLDRHECCKDNHTIKDFFSTSLRQLLEQVELKEYDTEGTLLDVNREQYEDGYNTASQQIKEIINEILK